MIAGSRSPGSAPEHPAFGLFHRYRAVLAAAWRSRREMAGPRRLADEAAFLPAALSLQETPPHPAPRRLAFILCSLFVAAALWATFGWIDIVAVAAGRIVVSDRTKTVQPLEAAVVRRILVAEGSLVARGQVLVELDATDVSADTASLQNQWQAASAEERRAAALMRALRDGRAPMLAEGGGAEAAAEPAVREQLRGEWDDITARLARLAAEHARRNAEIATVRQVIAKLEATLPIARQREADFRSLVEQGFMSSHAGQDRARERIEQEQDLVTQRFRLAEAGAALDESGRNRAAYSAETQRLLHERHVQAKLKRQQLTQELSKAAQRSRLTRLAAPVDGTVQQVAVHTEGGVVTPAQVLMIVVPSDAAVTAEVIVDNKDIGFVHAGDAARVKFETFPFTRYGTVDATVKSVTADAVSDERRGAVFPATLTLARRTIDVDGRRIGLSPGMNVTAEIRTGRRRVIDYLLGPVQRTLTESLGER